jgi:hypothetical protein
MDEQREARAKRMSEYRKFAAKCAEIIGEADQLEHLYQAEVSRARFEIYENWDGESQILIRSVEFLHDYLTTLIEAEEAPQRKGKSE